MKPDLQPPGPEGGRAGKRPEGKEQHSLTFIAKTLLCCPPSKLSLPKDVSPTLQTKSIDHITLFYFLHSIHHYLQDFLVSCLSKNHTRLRPTYCNAGAFRHSA